MNRNLLILVFGAICAIALAQVTVRVVGAEGRGIASNGNGRHGQFHFGVRKLVRMNEVRLEGNFEWREMSTTNTGAFTVVMARPTNIEVNNTHDVCEFGGPAKLSRMGPNGPTTIEGRLVCRVADFRRPHTGGTSGGGDGQDGTNVADLIRWQFISPVATVSYGFDGAVREGDIKVFARVLNGSTTGGGGGGTSGGGRGGG